MEETIREMDLLCEQKRGELDFQVSDLVRTYQNRIKNRIYDVLSDTISFIKPEQVERYIEDNLVKVLLNKFKEYNNAKFDNLRALNSTILRLSNGRSPEKLKGIMHLESNEIERRLNPEEFRSIITEFASNLSRSVASFLRKHNIRFDSKVDQAIYDISRYVPSRVNNVVEEIFGKYANLLHSELKTYVGIFDDHMDLKTQEQIEQQAKAQAPKVQTTQVDDQKAVISLLRNPTATLKDLKNNQELIESFGFKISETFDGLQITDRSTSKSMSLYRFSSNLLVSYDKSIKINIKNHGKFSIIKDSMIVNCEEYGISYGYKENPIRSRIVFDDNDIAHFYFCGQEQTDVVTIGIMMDDLEKVFPFIHKEFMSIPSYASLHREAEMREKENNALKKDEAGNIKLDPRSKDKYQDIISSCGLKMVEKEDGIYFFVSGEERKAKGEKTLRIEGVDEFFFNPNFYIVGSKEISGPYFEFRINNMKCIIPQDYSAINLFVNGVHHASRVDSDGNIRYFALKDKEQVCSAEDAKKFISELMPGLFNKNIEYSNGLLAQTNTEVVEEVKDLLNELETSQSIDLETKASEPAPVPYEENKEPEQETSIDQELAVLMEDPNVRRYIELMNLKKQQEEGYEAPSGPKM